MTAHSVNARFYKMQNKLPWVHTIMKCAAQSYDIVT